MGVTIPPQALPLADSRKTVSERVLHTNLRKLGKESNAMRKLYRTRAMKTLEKSSMWYFKLFTLFPMLRNLRYMDQVFRVVFPLAYVIFVIIHLAEVNFGADQYALLRQSSCYETAMSMA